METQHHSIIVDHRRKRSYDVLCIFNNFYVIVLALVSFVSLFVMLA